MNVLVMVAGAFLVSGTPAEVSASQSNPNGYLKCAGVLAFSDNAGIGWGFQSVIRLVGGSENEDTIFEMKSLFGGWNRFRGNVTFEDESFVFSNHPSNWYDVVGHSFDTDSIIIHSQTGEMSSRGQRSPEVLKGRCVYSKTDPVVRHRY